MQHGCTFLQLGDKAEWTQISGCELTSYIVPRGTSFHRWADLRFPGVLFHHLRVSRCGDLPGLSEFGAIDPDAMHDHGQPTRQGSLAICIAQALSQDHFFDRSMLWAAS